MTAPHLLLLHGALGTHRQFERIRRHLDGTFETHAFDFNGHGDHVGSGDFSMEVFTRDVLEYLSTHQIEKTYFFGYSMGGYVALNFATQYPERVESMVTYGTKFDWSPESAAREIKMLNPVAIEQKVPKFAEHLKRDHGQEHWKSVLFRTGEMMFSLGQNPPINNETLNRIQKRVLVCVGGEDRMVTREESQKAAQSLPQGQVKILPDFVHALEGNDPEALAQLVTKFLLDINSNTEDNTRPTNDE